MLAVAERSEEAGALSLSVVAAQELHTIVGLPGQIAQADATTIRVLLTAPAAALRRCAKAQKTNPLRTSWAVYCTIGSFHRWAYGQK
jgi:hypothetical protein